MAGTLSLRPFNALVLMREARAASIAALGVFCMAAFTYSRAQAIESKVADIGAHQRGTTTGALLVAAIAPGVRLDEGATATRLFTLVNQARAESRRCGDTVFRPARPLLWNEALTRAARVHSEDMARHNYFDHHSPDGSTSAQRLKRTGYVYRDRGENIAAGLMAPEEVIAGWINSPGHCSNIMEAEFTEMGVAVATNMNSQHGAYWTQVLATPRAVARRKDRG